MKKLIESANDGNKITDYEKDTLYYIYNNGRCREGCKYLDDYFDKK